MGIQFAVSIVIGALLGQWLDGQFGTEPILLLVFLAFGAAAAFRDLYRMARKELED